MTSEELDKYEAQIIEAIDNELRLYQARVAPLFRELAHVRSLKPVSLRLPLEGIQHD